MRSKWWPTNVSRRVTRSVSSSKSSFYFQEHRRGPETVERTNGRGPDYISSVTSGTAAVIVSALPFPPCRYPRKASRIFYHPFAPPPPPPPPSLSSSSSSSSPRARILLTRKVSTTEGWCVCMCVGRRGKRAIDRIHRCWYTPLVPPLSRPRSIHFEFRPEIYLIPWPPPPSLSTKVPRLRHLSSRDQTLNIWTTMLPVSYRRGDWLTRQICRFRCTKNQFWR